LNRNTEEKVLRSALTVSLRNNDAMTMGGRILVIL